MTTGPTEEFVRRTLDLSQEYLDDSIALLEQNRLRSAVDRAYYAIHYSAVALLSSQGIRPPRSHRGLVNVFGSEIVNRGILGDEFADMLSQGLRSRMMSTYSPGATITPDRAQETVRNAEQFVARSRSILNQ